MGTPLWALAAMRASCMWGVEWGDRRGARSSQERPYGGMQEGTWVPQDGSSQHGPGHLPAFPVVHMCSSEFTQAHLDKFGEQNPVSPANTPPC